MIFQELVLISTELIATIIMIVLMVFLLFMYLKIRVFVFILTIFLFSLIIGIMALTLEIPFTPYFQVFFILFQTIVFLITVMDLYNYEGK